MNFGIINGPAGKITAVDVNIDMILDYWILLFIGLVIFCCILGCVSAWWEKRNEQKKQSDFNRSDDETEDSTNDRDRHFNE